MPFKIRSQHSQRSSTWRPVRRSGVNSTTSNGACTTTTTTSPTPVNTTPKYVVAHHMVGNTYPYTSNDWLEDIIQAHGAGIDGFALNMGTDVWQPARVADA